MINTGRFALEIVTPEGRLTQAEVELVEFPGAAGELGVYAGHTPLLVALGVGELRVYANEQMQSYAVAGGYVEVRPEFVRVAATFASSGEEDAQIEQACQRAKLALENTTAESPSAIQAELQSLKFELARMADARRKQCLAKGK